MGCQTLFGGKNWEWAPAEKKPQFFRGRKEPYPKPGMAKTVKNIFKKRGTGA
jgi:hypothetical protein